MSGLEVGNNLYEVLEVPKKATASEIKKAYFKKALTCHPDKVRFLTPLIILARGPILHPAPLHLATCLQCPDDPEATARFQALSRAHAVLSDPEKRAVFDETGVVDDDDAGGGGGEGVWEDHFRSMFPAGALAEGSPRGAQRLGSCC